MEDSESCLLLIQKLFSEGSINDDQRDALKGKSNYTHSPSTDMLFDEDAILLSFFQRYSDPDEEEDLKTDVIKYVGGGNFGGKIPMEDQNTTGDSQTLDDVSQHYSVINLASDFVTDGQCRRHEEEALSRNASAKEEVGRAAKKGSRSIQRCGGRLRCQSSDEQRKHLL